MGAEHPNKVAVIYVHVLNSRHYAEYAKRFVELYSRFPPGMEHDTVIMENGGKPNEAERHLFADMPRVSFLPHDNSGYDIGAFQHAARDVPCDLMVFFGASTYFQRAGWLARMVETYKKHGFAQYGAMGNRGDMRVRVWPHIRTTAFWMPPELMRSYPQTVTRSTDRHPFEHGPNCFTAWVEKRGLKSWVVTWDRELLWKDWDSDPNGYSRGNQSSLLAGDHMCEPPYYPKT